MDALCMILEIRLVLQRYSADLAPDPISFFDVGQMLPLEAQSPGLANDLMRFSSGRLFSPKQRKHKQRPY